MRSSPTASRCRRFATNPRFAGFVRKSPIKQNFSHEVASSREATTVASRSVTSASEEPTVYE
jgi:hypothetical protein